jgi:hypothetical protein
MAIKRYTAGLTKEDFFNSIEEQLVSKPHLTPKYGVASFFEMLIYDRVRCASFPVLFEVES